MPTAKRQPNLLFAAARYLLGEPPDLAALRALLSDHEDELADVMLARRTQTNEPKVPDIVWRAGLDLNPLDVTNDDDVRWLRCLVWPGETGRQERLGAAIDTARRDPPRLYRGDLVTDLPGVIGDAPPGATVVVYHSAVLAYVRRADRARFADTVSELAAVWLSNEAPGVLPGIDVAESDAHGFLLVRDGTEPLAVTDSHGTWVDWLG